MACVSLVHTPKTKSVLSFHLPENLTWPNEKRFRRRNFLQLRRRRRKRKTSSIHWCSPVCCALFKKPWKSLHFEVNASSLRKRGMHYLIRGIFVVENGWGPSERCLISRNVKHRRKNHDSESASSEWHFCVVFDEYEFSRCSFAVLLLPSTLSVVQRRDWILFLAELEGLHTAKLQLI